MLVTSYLIYLAVLCPDTQTAFWYLFEPETLLALSDKTKTHKWTTFARDLQGHRYLCHPINVLTNGTVDALRPTLMKSSFVACFWDTLTFVVAITIHPKMNNQ